MKVITANRLSDGIVVFLSAQGWVADIASAAILNAPDAIEAGLTAAERSESSREILAFEAIDVSLDENERPVPVRLRERIRAFGPTVQYGAAARQSLVA